MTINQACEILNIEIPEYKIGLMSRMDKDIFFDDVKEKYLNLIKQNHPDMGGEHDKSAQIIEAFQFIRDQINKVYSITLTERFEKNVEKQKEYNIKRKNNYIKKNHKIYPTSKAVYQYDLNKNFIKKWDSMAQIKRELKFDQGAVSRAVNGKLKQYKGFIWSNTLIN